MFSNTNSSSLRSLLPGAASTPDLVTLDKPPSVLLSQPAMDRSGGIRIRFANSRPRAAQTRYPTICGPDRDIPDPYSTAGGHCCDRGTAQPAGRLRDAVQAARFRHGADHRSEEHTSELQS